VIQKQNPRSHGYAIFHSYDQVTQFIEKCKEEDCTFYTIIRPQRPCYLFFDLDMVSTQTAVSHQKILSVFTIRIKNLLINLFGYEVLDQYSKFALFFANKQDKTSYYLYTRLPFANIETEMYLLSRIILDQLLQDTQKKDEDALILQYMEGKEKGKYFCNLGVYNKNLGVALPDTYQLKKKNALRWYCAGFWTDELSEEYFTKDTYVPPLREQLEWMNVPKDLQLLPPIDRSLVPWNMCRASNSARRNTPFNTREISKTAQRGWSLDTKELLATFQQLLKICGIAINPQIRGIYKDNIKLTLDKCLCSEGNHCGGIRRTYTTLISRNVYDQILIRHGCWKWQQQSQCGSKWIGNGPFLVLTRKGNVNGSFLQNKTRSEKTKFQKQLRDKLVQLSKIIVANISVHGSETFEPATIDFPRDPLEQARQNNYFGIKTDFSPTRSEDGHHCSSLENILLQNHPVLLKAGTGTGKTEAVVKTMTKMWQYNRRESESGGMLTVGDLKSLIIALVGKSQKNWTGHSPSKDSSPKDMNFKHYKDASARSSKNVITTLHSLWKFANRNPYILWIDEIYDVLDYLHSSTLVSSGVQMKVYNSLVALIKKAKFVIFTSADISDKELRFVSNLRDTEKTLFQWYKDESPQVLGKQLFVRNNDIKAMFQNVVDCLKEGQNLFVTSSSKKRIDTLFEYVIKTLPEVQMKRYTSDSVAEELQGLGLSK